MQLSRLQGHESHQFSPSSERTSDDQSEHLTTDLRHIMDIDEGMKNTAMRGTSNQIPKPLTYMDQIVLNPALQSN